MDSDVSTDDDVAPEPPRLPPELQKKIDQALSVVYRQAFDVFPASDSSSASADVSRITGESILIGVRESIAVALQADNARLSQQCRLPIELWCNVWRHLSFRDLVFATHVCTRWRSLALNDPTLWQHIDFYTTHHSGWCCCTSCGPGHGLGLQTNYAPGWKENPYRPDSTNIRQPDFDVLLGRSRELPLHVTVYVVPCREDDDTDLFGEWFDNKHTRRLRGLTIFTADPDAPARLLDAFEVLPTLKNLIVRGLPVDNGNYRVRDHRVTFPRGVQLPLLDKLRLSTRVLPPPTDSLPSVRTLWIEPTDLVADLRRALDACPDAWWRERTALLRTVTVSVSHISASCERWLRAALSPAIPTIYLSYPARSELSEGGDVLSDLGSDIHLSVTLIPSNSEDTELGDFLAVYGKDSEQRVRQVGFHLDSTPSREDLLRIVAPGLDDRWRNIVSLTAHASLWPLVVSTIPAPDGGAAISSLCIIVDAVTHRPLSRPPPSNDAPALPALRSLRLELGTQALSMTPEEVSDFVRGLQVPLPLDVLEIERQLLSGDATDTLRNLAGTVSLV